MIRDPSLPATIWFPIISLELYPAIATLIISHLYQQTCPPL